MSDAFSFYKYVNIRDALLIINNKTLMFTNPLDFNDPFDIAPVFPEVGLSKFHSRILQKHGQAHELFGRKRIDYLKSMDFNELRKKFLKSWGVTCFSKSPFILPLWAHYANNHKGCVLEFRVTEKMSNQIKANNGILADIVYPLNVTYNKKRPKAYDENGVLTGKSAQNILLTKDTAWAYEQEMRAFSDNSPGIHPFNKDQLHRVYCGLKMEEDSIKQIESSVKNYQKLYGKAVKVEQVHLDRNEYKMSKF